jgi:hypothetical protein
MSSLPAPEASSHLYRRILVVVPLPDLALRRAAEDRFVSAFPGSASVFVPSYTVFFPGRTYTHDEVVRVLLEHGIEARLELSPGESGMDTYGLGSVTDARCTERTTTGDCVAATSRTTTTERSQPWSMFTAKLFDQVTGEAVWMASGKTVGNDYAQWSNIVKSMAATTARRLRADGVIP